ncbi:MAG TPA: methyltransferase [Gammaproteobacteria bacterium]|nr:methyltransferase [Gammaproteobacteria bacterium]
MIRKEHPLSRLLSSLLLVLAVAAPALAADAPSPSLDQAIAGAHRSAENRARDVYRHPAETLRFFGIAPTMTVIEILPGEGWYTEILAPYLAPAGKLAIATHEPDSPNEYRREGHKALMAKLDAAPALYGAVERRVMWQGDGVSLGPPASADMVLTFRNTHNWINDGKMEAVYQACFDVLKSGGVLGVEQHRAPAGADAAASAKKGYVPEGWLIEQIEGVGFKLVDKSEINANPKDTKDYADGVWTLPPVLRLGEKDREKYLAIGESDRMTLKFIKP